MSNSCCGTLKVVAKSEDTLKRIESILNYDDAEYCLYRCKYVHLTDTELSDGFFIGTFTVDGAWSCEPFFSYTDSPDKKVILDYEKDENGFPDSAKPIYGTAHFTNLCHLAKVLDFGCELYACESGQCFCEHFACDHKGNLTWFEHGEYNLVYPKGEDGEPDYDEEPEEEFGIEGYDEFCYPNEIYYSDDED